MIEMQKLLALAVAELAVIKAHTEGMHGQLGRIDASTTDLNEHTQDLGDNTAKLVRIASPLERARRAVSPPRQRRGHRRVNKYGEDAPRFGRWTDRVGTTPTLRTPP